MSRSQFFSLLFIVVLFSTLIFYMSGGPKLLAPKEKFENSYNGNVIRELYGDCDSTMRQLKNWLPKKENLALDRAIYSNDRIVEWLSAAVPTVLTISHHDFQKDMMAIRPYFTTDGWCSYINALNDNGFFKTSLGNKLDMTAVAHGSPVIKSSEVVKGGYAWNAEDHIEIQYQSESNLQNSRIKDNDVYVFIRVSRIASPEQEGAVAIDHWDIVDNSVDNTPH